MKWIYPPHIKDQINRIDEQVKMLLNSKIRLIQNSVPKLLLTEEEVLEMDCEKVLIKLKPKPMTNADRIRNMSDEELASFLIAMQVATKVRNRVDSRKEIDEYLQAEVKEGAENDR